MPPKTTNLNQLKQQLNSIRNGAIQSIFSVNVQTTNDDPSYPSANSFPLILELDTESAELLDAVCQVLIHSGTGNILNVRSSYLDFHDGSDPRPLIHIGFTTTYISTYLSNDDPSFDTSLHLSDSQQKVQLLAYVRRARLEHTTVYGRSVLFADDNLPQELHAIFDNIDDNHDGFLSLDEIEKIVSNHSQALAILKEYDIDGDGRIDFQEWSRHGLVDFLTMHGILKRTFLRHNHDLRDKLNDKWNEGHSHTFGLTIPRPDVLNYLGNDCTMYFEFVTFYTWSLTWVACLGLVLSLSNKTNSQWMLGFTTFATIWSSVFLNSWKQRQYQLEKIWKDPKIHNHVKFFKLSHDYKHKSIKRYGFRRATTTLASILMVYFVFTIDLWLLQYKLQLDESLNAWLHDETLTSTGAISIYHNIEIQANMKWYVHKLYSQLPGIMKAIVMTLFDEVFKKVIQKMIQFEKKKTKAEENDSKMMKLVLFQFVSKFMYLFYFGLVLQDIQKVKNSLFGVLIMSMLVQNFKEHMITWIKIRWKEASLLSNRRQVSSSNNLATCTPSTTLVLTHMEEDYMRKEYDNTFEDYLEMLLQYGQIMLFAAVFPVGGALALINNLAEIKGDSYKMLYELNPMVPRDERVGEEKHHFAINLWVSGFIAVSYLALVTNLLLLSCDIDSQSEGYQHFFLGYKSWVFSRGVLESGVEVIAVMAVFEHALLVIKGLLYELIPDRQKTFSLMNYVLDSYRNGEEDEDEDEDEGEEEEEEDEDEKDMTKEEKKMSPKKKKQRTRTKSKARRRRKVPVKK
jgi:hypothetical protein